MRIPTLDSEGERGQVPGLGIFAVLVFGAVALVVLSIILLLGMQLVGQAAIGLGSVQPPANYTSGPDPVTGEAVEFADTAGPSKVLAVYSVKDSTGYGVFLTGAADSYYQSKKKVNLASDDTWSVSTWAEVAAAGENDTMTAVSADGRVLIQYNGSTSEWVGWYYDDGTGNSYRLAGGAPNQPGNLTLVTVTANASHVVLYRNATQLDVQSVTTDAVENADLGAGNWHGTLDETRVFDDFTNASEQSTLHSEPVAPRPRRDRTARIMFDEGSGSVADIYFTGTAATLSNHSWVSGLAGHELTDGADYTLNQHSGTITALDGGKIDGAPVVWVTYRYEGLNDVGVVARNIGRSFELFGESVIVIPAAALLATLIGGLVGAITLAGGRGGTERGGR